MKYGCTIETPIGRLTALATQDALTNLFFAGQTPQPYIPQDNAVLQAAAQQLSEYFAGQRKIFTLPLAPQGTAFQTQVWSALQQIPWGETRTYAQLAAYTGNPKACRAVGGANNRNPLPILIPCHRVIGSNGTLTGYAGGLAAKQYLLALEGIIIQENLVYGQR